MEKYLLSIMKNKFLNVALFLLLMIPCCIYAQDNLSALIPMPNKVTSDSDMVLVLENQVNCYIETDSLEFELNTLSSIFNKRFGINVKRSTESSKSVVQLLIDKSLKTKEHYQLSVNEKRLVIKGATSAAVFYGLMTLDQILAGDICATKEKTIASVEIDDCPRFDYRALMLDPARNFLPIDDIKFYIDQMVKYKFNVLQLHLTDDHGWSIWIESHPSLAGARFYTKKDIQELVDYAAMRHVQVIPEVDMPGHTVFLLSKYPNLACIHQRQTEKIIGKTGHMMLCAGNEEVYAVMDDIIGEVAKMFKSPLIHLGGDEADIPKNWAQCDLCRTLMEKRKYTKPSQLMIPFFENILGSVRKYGKKPILWLELNNVYPPADDYLFPYPQDVTLVNWREGMTPTGLDFSAKKGHNVIMAPSEYTYFDYPQYKGELPEYNNWGMPITTLERAYKLDPGYGRPLEAQKHIWGVMGPLWGEAIIDINRATYMTYPRAFALAEAGWTQMDNRGWESFKKRVLPNITELMKTGVSVRVPFEITR